MKHKGFLSILAVLLIVIISFICVSATYQLTAQANTASVQLSSTKAFYLAQSGLYAAQHAIVTNSNSCTFVNNNANFMNLADPFTGAAGVFLVTGSANNVSTSLNGNLNTSATVINITNGANFANNGVVLVDSELISYTGLTGNSLTGVTRGVGNTSAVSHNNGASVIQRQCVLLSKGSVPNAVSPLGQRTLQAVLSAGAFSLNLNQNLIAIPSMVSTGNINLSGNSIIANSSVTSTSNNLKGATIIASGTVAMGGNSVTKINSSTGLVVSSFKNNLKADVIQNNTDLNSSNLFLKYFNQPKATVKATSVQTYESDNINGATGKTIWINGNLTLSSNQIIGTAKNPVLLIVNGNVSLSNSSIINGLLYATGTISIAGNAVVNGMIAAEQSINASGNSYIAVYNASIANKFSSINNYINAQYNSTFANLQEIFA